MTASLSSSSTGKPLRLKDLLRDDPNSDSSFGGGGSLWIGHRRFPEKTMAYFLDRELGGGSGRDRTLTKCRSKGTLTKLTAVVNAVKMLPFTSSGSVGCGHSGVKLFPKQTGGLLPRSFSRKLRRSLWGKREKGDLRVDTAVRTIVRVKDIMRLRSFGDERRAIEPATERAPAPRSPPSPIRSTHSRTTSSSSADADGAWSDTDTAGSDSLSCGTSAWCSEVKDGSSNNGTNNCASPLSPYNVAAGVAGDSMSKSPCYREHKKDKEEERGGGGGDGQGAASCPCHFEAEKDQLSPVSVMEFPYEEEGGDGGGVDAAGTAGSPTCFRRSLANLERSKQQLLQRIREFESLAELVGPVDLDSRFESSEDENEPDRLDHEREGADDGDRLSQFQLEVEARALALLRDLELRGGSPLRKTAAADLLMDFFVERLSRPRREGGGIRGRTTWWPDRVAAAAAEEEALLRAAEDWVAGRWREDAAEGRQAEVREMEMGGRWRYAHVEEEEGEEIAGGFGDAILESLVMELVASLS